MAIFISGGGFLITMLTLISFSNSFKFWKLRRSKDFRKLYLGVQIFEYYVEDTGLQRYPLSTKDFCNFSIRTSIRNRPFLSPFFEGLNFLFLVISFYFRTGRVERKTGMGRFKVKKIPKILGTHTNTLFRRGYYCVQKFWRTLIQVVY